MRVRDGKAAANKHRSAPGRSQRPAASVPGSARAAALLAIALLAACNAPVSTVRSPYHLRVVEVRNTTDANQILLIAPTESQHLGAATTFTGDLRPGEVKVLYLYHGFEYRFEIVEGESDAAATTVKVDRDMGLAFA